MRFMSYERGLTGCVVREFNAKSQLVFVTQAIIVSIYTESRGVAKNEERRELMRAAIQPF